MGRGLRAALVALLVMGLAAPAGAQTKEQQLDTHSGNVRMFVDQEIPEVADWNANPTILQTALALIGDFFTDVEDDHSALKTLFEVEHDAATGVHAPPAEWVVDATTPTFVSTAQFQLAGDRRADYAVAHRVRVTQTGGDMVVSITAVSFFSSATTISVTSPTNPAPLNAGLSAVARGIVRFSAPRVRTEDLMPGAVTEAAVADGAITGQKVATGTLGTSNYLDQSITTAKLADLSVVTAKLADGAVTTDKLGADAVTDAKIADGVLMSSHFATGAVDNAALAANAVAGGNIQSGAIDAGHLAAALQDATVTGNLLRDSTFRAWVSGAPAAWTVVGDGTTTRATASPAGQVDAQALQLTAGTAATTVEQVAATITATANLHLRSRDVVAGVWVYTDTASAGRLRVSDGVTTASSSFHTGNSTWQFLTVTHTMSATADDLTIELQNALGDSSTDVYFAGAFLGLGTLAPSTHQPAPADRLLEARDYQDEAGTAVPVAGVVEQSGWGFINVGTPGSSDDAFAATITFPRAFKQVLAVHILAVGFKDSDPTSLLDTIADAGLDGTDTRRDQPDFSVRSGTLSTTGMQVLMLRHADVDWGSTTNDRRYLFTWTVKGLL